jgi:hypothetical protein
MGEEMEEGEGFFVRLFAVLRGSLPVVEDDFARRVGRRVTLLSDDPRLASPGPEEVAGGFLSESLGLLVSWWRSLWGGEGDG